MKIYQLFFCVYACKKVLINNFITSRDKKDLMDSVLKKYYFSESLSLTAGFSTPNYYLKEKSSYLPAILAGCWLLYSCSVSHFSIYRLGYFSFYFMLSQFIAPALSTGVDSHVCAQKGVCTFLYGLELRSVQIWGSNREVNLNCSQVFAGKQQND